MAKVKVDVYNNEYLKEDLAKTSDKRKNKR
jgi:hypothetical protein